jgi:hypothetical protein
MFNPRHPRRLYSSAKILGLDFCDTARWFWSYYASRLPRIFLRNVGCVQVALHHGADNPPRLIVRNNEIDCDVVEEIFVRNVYRMNLSGVKRVLDLDGNIRLAAAFFAWKYPEAEICTVERIPDNLAVLERCLKLNRAVRVVPAAVGVQDGKTPLRNLERSETAFRGRRCKSRSLAHDRGDP